MVKEMKTSNQTKYETGIKEIEIYVECINTIPSCVA